MWGKSRISCDIDLDADGKHFGFLRLPHSVHRSAYGWLPFPLASIRNGRGPTVYLQGGSHGDEYEGQVALCKLMQELEPADIHGRVIILPAANAPAAREGLRNSPIDGASLNRAFPGNPDGTPTEMIAHYIESVFLDLADYVIDIHSGGASMMMASFAEIKDTGIEEQDALSRALLSAFGCSIGCITDQIDDRTTAAAAVRAGCLFLGTELGGGATVTPRALAIAEDGIRRVLKHASVLREDYPISAPGPMRLMSVGGSEFYVHATDDGVFEPYVDLLSEVTAGEAAGAIHFPETPWREPMLVSFEIDGAVLMKRLPGRCQRGDCLFHVACDIDL